MNSSVSVIFSPELFQSGLGGDLFSRISNFKYSDIQYPHHQQPEAVQHVPHPLQAAGQRETEGDHHHARVRHSGPVCCNVQQQKTDAIIIRPNCIVGRPFILILSSF